jgi:hypothetical protein
VEVEADDDLLDLDLDPTAEAEELIKALNSDDYDPPADVVAPAPKPPDPPAAPKPPDPPKDDSDSRMTFEAYRRMCAFAADDEEDLFTRAISGAGSASSEPTEEAATAAASELVIEAKSADGGDQAPDRDPGVVTSEDLPDADLDLTEMAPSDDIVPSNPGGNPATLLRARRAKKAAKKAKRERDKTAARMRKYRAKQRAVAEKTAEEILKELEASPCPEPIPGRLSRQYHKRLIALQAATANPKGDKFLIRIRGRETELADAWLVEQKAQNKLGKKPSQATVARLHPDRSMTKRRVQSLRDLLEKLEAPGRPWNGL